MLTSEEPSPLSAQVLYFDGDPLVLVAWDAVELDPLTQDLTVRRNLASELGEPDAEELAPEEEPVSTP